MLGYKNRTFGKVNQVFVGTNVNRRAAADAGECYRSILNYERVSFDPRKRPGSLLSKVLHVERSGLQNEQAPMAVERPFDILRVLIMLLQSHCVPGQLLHLVRVKTRSVTLFLSDRQFRQSSGRFAVNCIGL